MSLWPWQDLTPSHWIFSPELVLQAQVCVSVVEEVVKTSEQDSHWWSVMVPF